MTFFEDGVSRRTFLRLSVGVGGVLLIPPLLEGCSAPGGQSGAATLIVAAITTPASIDQDLDTSAQSHEIRMNTMDRLMAYGLKPSPEPGVQEEDFTKIVPRLAKSWELSADSRQITFQIRDGVKSPWGNTLSADDVKWTWDRAWALNTVGAFYLKSVLKMKEPKWEVLNPLAIKLSIPDPSPLLGSLWINMDLGIFDSQEAKKHTKPGDPWARDWVSQNSPSFAPYQVTVWNPGSKVELTAWKGFYGGAPSIQRVVFEQVPVSSNRLSLVLGGSAQIAEDLAPRDFASVQKSGSVHPVSLAGNSIYRVEVNNQTAPFNSPLVRQALNYAVDRSAVIQGPFAGLGAISKSPLPPTYPGYTDRKFQFNHDPAKAKSLLAQAGYPNGFPTTLSYRAESSVENEMARLIQTNLADVGVQITLSKQPASTYLQNILTHQYPMYLYVDSSILPNPAYALNLWLASNSAINYSQYHNKEVDALIAELLTTLDSAKTEELAKQVQDLVVQDPPWIYLVDPGFHIVLSSSLKGFVWRTPVNPVEYYGMTLA